MSYKPLLATKRTKFGFGRGRSGRECVLVVACGDDLSESSAAQCQALLGQMLRIASIIGNQVLSSGPSAIAVVLVFRFYGQLSDAGRRAGLVPRSSSSTTGCEAARAIVLQSKTGKAKASRAFGMSLMDGRYILVLSNLKLILFVRLT